MPIVDDGVARIGTEHHGQRVEREKRDDGDDRDDESRELMEHDVSSRCRNAVALTTREDSPGPG